MLSGRRRLRGHFILLCIILLSNVLIKTDVVFAETFFLYIKKCINITKVFFRNRNKKSLDRHTLILKPSSPGVHTGFPIMHCKVMVMGVAWGLLNMKRHLKWNGMNVGRHGSRLNCCLEKSWSHDGVHLVSPLWSPNGQSL